eukprot:6586433-Prymnesium_polylepis.1
MEIGKKQSERDGEVGAVPLDLPAEDRRAAILGRRGRSHSILGARKSAVLLSDAAGRCCAALIWRWPCLIWNGRCRAALI